MYAVVTKDVPACVVRQHQVERHNVQCCSRCGRPTVDPVSGLADRWGWSQRAARVLRGVREGGLTAALLFADLDRFKEVNDTYGHAAGDVVLAAVGEALLAVTRAGDVLGRANGYVGDEFVALLPRCEMTAAAEVARRFQQRIRELVVRVETVAGMREVTGLSTSVGIAVGRPGRTLSDLIVDADSALLAAKKSGRNRIRIYEP